MGYDKVNGDNMNEITINLVEEYGHYLESKELAIEIFENIPNGVDKVIFNFQRVYNIGCFFAREFLRLSKKASFDVVREYVISKETFDLVEKCDDSLSDEEFIEFLKENTCHVKVDSDDFRD